MKPDAQNLEMETTSKKRVSDRRYAEEAARLVAARNVRGMSQIDFAAWLDVPYKTYHANETGNRHVSLEIAKRIRERMGFSLDWIYTGDESMLRADLSKALSDIRKAKSS